MHHLLIIAHTPSENLIKLRNALQEGVSRTGVSDVALTVKAPLQSDAKDALNADAIIILTPENLGYMAGATKDWFDRIYYPTLELKQGMPLVTIIRAGHDGTGTERALKTITTGLRWRWVQDALILKGDYQATWEDDLKDVGEAIATALSEGII